MKCGCYSYRLACARCHENLLTSNLRKAHETRDSLSSFYSQVVLIYLYPFRRNSLVKSTQQPQIAKNTKTPILEVQGHLRSSMFTSINSLSLLPVMISSVFLPICNRFHATRANSSKITTFREIAVFEARLQGHSRSSMFTPIKSLSLLPVIISSLLELQGGC